MLDVTELWVIYEKPYDYPDQYVLRRHRLFRAATINIPDEQCFTAQTLDEIRELLPSGLFRVQGPGYDSDPKIIEVWV